MDIDKIKKIIKRIVESTPAAIPYAGSIYTHYLVQLSSEELKLLSKELQGLSSEQYETLATMLQDIWITNQKKIQELTNLIEELVEKKAIIKKCPAIIPCGGKAGSMYPFSSGMPKTLFIIDTKPILHHILDSLDKNLFSKKIIITREFSAAIKRSVDSRNRSNEESRKIDKDVPAALIEIKGELKDTFLIHYNDILIPRIDWEHVFRHYHYLKDAFDIIGMLVCSSYYPLGIGTITEMGQDLIKSFDEKPECLVGMYANMGVSLFDHRFLSYVRPTDESIYRESIERAQKEGNEKFGMFKVDLWFHIHDLKDYHDMQMKYYPEDMK